MLSFFFYFDYILILFIKSKTFVDDIATLRTYPDGSYELAFHSPSGPLNGASIRCFFFLNFSLFFLSLYHSPDYCAFFSYWYFLFKFLIFKRLIFSHFYFSSTILVYIFWRNLGQDKYAFLMSDDLSNGVQITKEQYDFISKNHPFVCIFNSFSFLSSLHFLFFKPLPLPTHLLFFKNNCILIFH